MTRLKEEDWCDELLYEKFSNEIDVYRFINRISRGDNLVRVVAIVRGSGPEEGNFELYYKVPKEKNEMIDLEKKAENKDLEWQFKEVVKDNDYYQAENKRLEKENKKLKKQCSDEECLKRLSKKGYIKFSNESIAELEKENAELKAHLPQWHDLRKDSEDLPESDREKMYYVMDKDGRYTLARYYCDTWSDTDIIENVTAWYELPEFEELEKGDK